MCDYSLHAMASRPAKVGETLITTTFPRTSTRGFAAEGEPGMAVCLLPGTELAFEQDVKYDQGWIWTRTISFRVAKLEDRADFRRKLFRGQGYLAQTGGTSRAAPRKTAIGDRDGPRSTSLRPRAYLLSFRELVFGAGNHSKCAEANRPLLACSSKFRTDCCDAQRR